MSHDNLRIGFFGGESSQSSERSLKSCRISEGVAPGCAVHRSLSALVLLSNDSPVAR